MIIIKIIGFILGMFAATEEIEAQSITSFIDSPRRKIVWYVTNSPQNYPNPCVILYELRRDTIINNCSKNMIPSVANSTINGSYKMVSINPSGMMSSINFSNISLPFSQITGTPAIGQTSITGDGAVTITGSFPSFTVSAPAQTLQAIPPTTLNLNGYDIYTTGGNTVALPQPVTPTITGTGNSTVTGTWPTININSSFNQTVQSIPASSLAITGNSLSIIGSNTVTIPTSSTAYSGGTGINVTGTVITNTSPNVTQVLSINANTINLSNGGGSATIPTQTVPITITGSTGISVGGAHPNFTVTNTIPDQTVTLTGANGLTITGTYPTFTVTQKRELKYSLTTDASGNVTAAFTPTFTATPIIQVCLINPNVRDTPIPQVSASGFTVNVQRRTDVLGLLPSYANVVGGTVHVTILEN